jgi:hypothetical protein
MGLVAASESGRGTATRRAGHAGLAACIALIAGLGIATHLPAAAHGAHSATSVSHTYVVVNSPTTVTGGPGTM